MTPEIYELINEWEAFNVPFMGNWRMGRIFDLHHQAQCFLIYYRLERWGA